MALPVFSLYPSWWILDVREREREIVFLEDENDDGDAGFVERHCGLLLVFEQIKSCVDAIYSSVGE